MLSLVVCVQMKYIFHIYPRKQGWHFMQTASSVFLGFFCVFLIVFYLLWEREGVGGVGGGVRFKEY